MKFADVSTLTLWDKNPREIDDKKFNLLKKYIEKWGLLSPLKVTPDNEVLGGNHRLKAVRELGWDKVWVHEVSPSSDAEKLEIAMLDNQEFATWIEKDLKELITNTPGLELDDFSVTLQTTPLSDLFENDQEVIEDEAPELDEQEEPLSKLGEVYQLGRHRLMCGDSTKIEDVEKLMDGKKADMVFTDPPYNVDYTGKTKESLKIENDKKNDNEFFDFLLQSFTTLASFVKSGAAIYVCHSDSEGLNFRRAFQEAGFLLKQCIIWNKNSMVMGRQDYQWKHEPILYGWKAGGSHAWYGSRSETTVWDIDRPTKSTEHPTMKPIALIAKALHNSSKGGDIVVDLFGGSGSTLVTCEQIDRTCFTMELDPHYCDVIRKRYWKLIDPENWETKWADQK